MATPLEDIRGELSTRFDPPVDVILDASLLVAANTLNRLADSRLFEAHTQATLFQSSGETHVGEVFIPATFHRLLVQEGGVDAERTEAWNQYKQQAKPAEPDIITDSIDQLGINTYAADDWPTPREAFHSIGDEHNEYLSGIARETLAFLAEGGLLFLRTGVTIDALRDGGVPTLDIGDATLTEEVETKLERVGYGDPATLCAFGLTSGSTVLEALTDSVLSAPADTLIYRVG